MSNENGRVEVNAIVHRTRDWRGAVYRLRIQCPYCGTFHTHGGGTKLSEVAQMGGYRVPHCSIHSQTSAPDYYIIVRPDFQVLPDLRWWTCDARTALHYDAHCPSDKRLEVALWAEDVANRRRHEKVSLADWKQGLKEFSASRYTEAGIEPPDFN